MAQLDIWKVYVVDEQEANGDELYFKVNGKVATETTPSLHTGQTHVFALDPEWFSGTAKVELWEADPGKNPDDHIATAWIPSSHESSDNPVWMDGHGGMYDAYFLV